MLEVLLQTRQNGATGMSNSKFGSLTTSKFRICFIFLAKICVSKRLEAFKF